VTSPEEWWSDTVDKIAAVDQGLSISMAGPDIIRNMISLSIVADLKPELWDSLGDWAIGRFATITSLDPAHPDYDAWTWFTERLGEIMPPEVRDVAPSERP
jgi:hypothetical protein